MKSFPVEELDWWHLPQPTPEELRLSGGLQVEDWPHARQVERLSVQLFEATQPLHNLMKAHCVCLSVLHFYTIQV